jgi:hypothetical protein
MNLSLISCNTFQDYPKCKCVFQLWMIQLDPYNEVQFIDAVTASSIEGVCFAKRIL